MMHLRPQVQTLPPFLLEPRFVERIWGARDLRPWYDHSSQPAEMPVGEVWLTGDDCRVAAGELAGMTLGQVFAAHARAMLGEPGTQAMRGESPLLLKVLFAREKLSVQVHPDDGLAQKYGQPRGKTECWYALAAEPGAQVAAGLRPGVTLAAVERGVAAGTLEECLAVIDVERGDMIYVDAGTVHAIWPGSVILETQQNCDLTYRLYDYGRPRELHVAKALEATRLTTGAGKIAPIELDDRTVLVDREYFCVEKMRVEGVRSGASMPRKGEPAGLSYFFAASGQGQILPGRAGDFEDFMLPSRGVAAVPASSPGWKVEDLGGLNLIRITPRFPVCGTLQIDDQAEDRIESRDREGAA